MRILKISDAAAGLHFEWHEARRAVYLVDRRVSPAPGVAAPALGVTVALNVADPGAAVTAVQIWLRGWRHARNERNPPHEHKILA